MSKYMVVEFPGTASEEIVLDGFTTRYRAMRALGELDREARPMDVVEDFRQ